MRFAVPALAAICILTLFVGLDRVGFLDWREARDVQVAREMLERHEALTPLLAREPLFEKPAPAYGPDVLLQLLDRDTPAASRATRGGIAVALVVLIGSIGARLFGARAGLFTALVLGTSLALPMAARVDGTQLLATLLAWVGVAGLADAQFGRPPGRDLRLIVAWGALAAVLMVAGPLPALWPVGGWALYVALARSKAGWKRARVPAGLLIVIGIALPWYGAMFERHGMTFLSSAAFFPYAAETRGAWWSGPVLTVSFLVVGFFPWSAILPGAMTHAATWWRRVIRLPILQRRDGSAPVHDPIEREVREEGAAHFFIACLFAALAPIAVYPGPPLTAVLPALPAAALLCGRLLDHLFEDAARLKAPVRNAGLMLALVGTVGGVLLTLVGPRIREATDDLRLLGTMVFVTSWIPLLAYLLGRPRVAALALALPVIVGAPLVSLRVMPAMENWLNARAVAQAMTVTAPRHAPLVVADDVRPSLRRYATHNIVDGTPLVRAIETYRASDGLTYLAFRPFRESSVASAAGPLEIVLRTPTLVLARVHPR